MDIYKLGGFFGSRISAADQINSEQDSRSDEDDTNGDDNGDDECGVVGGRGWKDGGRGRERIGLNVGFADIRPAFLQSIWLAGDGDGNVAKRFRIGLGRRRQRQLNRAIGPRSQRIAREGGRRIEVDGGIGTIAGDLKAAGTIAAIVEGGCDLNLPVISGLCPAGLVQREQG